MRIPRAYPRWKLSAVLTLCLVGLPACKDAGQRYEEQRVVSTPLEFDPTEEYEIAEWWSDGTQLLRLAPNGAYSLYSGTNRHRTPLERGRWRQQNYATLWFEPYDRLSREQIRIGVNKIGGRIALLLPDSPPMFALDAAPTTLEDRLIGRWTGASGVLVLSDDLRYSFTPSGEARDEPVSVAIHRGRWHVAKELVILQPDFGAEESISLPIYYEGGKPHALVAGQVQLQRTPAREDE